MRNFSQLEVGHIVTLIYYRAIAMELQPPGNAKPGESTAAIHGPRGNSRVVAVCNPSYHPVLPQLRKVILCV